MTKVLGTKLSTLWTRINTVLVPRQATVTTTGSYHIVTLQNAVTPTPDALVSFSIPASSGGSGDTNQNAFSNVKVGSSTISATSITDTLSVTAGSNISLSVNSKTLTISATDTTYTAATVAPLAVSSSSVTGTSTNYARQDHTHSITVTTGDSNGQVKIAGTNVSVKGLKSAAYTESSAYLPSNTTIPTAMSQLNNDAGYLTSADIPEGASAYSGTISTVTSGTATAGTNNGFARGDHVHNITATTITNALGYTPYSAANPNNYTSNTGTVTGVKINNSTKAPSSGVVDLGTVLTTYTYTLPTASTTTLGGIKIGNGLNIGTTGVVSANVQSVNTKTGAVTLTAADVGALPSSTVVPTQTSQLQNNSGFLTSAITSLNSKTGAVTIAAGDNVTVSSSSNTITISATDTDTKNTVGATVTSSKIYLVGTTTQTTCPQSYTSNYLYYNNGLQSGAITDTIASLIVQSGGTITLSVINDIYSTNLGSLYISSNGVEIKHVVTPTATGDAANKEYVDKGIVPIGTILDFAGFTPPTGYLICDGSAVSRTTYADLFEILKDENDNLPWGDGDGSTTFNLPNLCGRTTIGVGTITDTSSNTETYSIATVSGEIKHKLAYNESGVANHTHTAGTYKGPNHRHAAGDYKGPNHRHGLYNSMLVYNNNSKGGQLTGTGGYQTNSLSQYATDYSGTSGAVTGNSGYSGTSGAVTGSSGDTTTAAASAAHNNMQPYAAVNKIIKAL